MNSTPAELGGQPPGTGGRAHRKGEEVAGSSTGSGQSEHPPRGADGATGSPPAAPASPTTGLDPQNRANLWDQLRKLRSAGTAIFLTTHYLEEADALADRVAIVDHGKVVAEGTSTELKRRLAGDVVSVRPRSDGQSIEDLRTDLAHQPFVAEARLEGETIRLYVTDGAQALPLVFDHLRTAGVLLDSVSVAEPSLDDVFLQQTGRSLRDTAADGSSKEVAA